MYIYVLLAQTEQLLQQSRAEYWPPSPPNRISPLSMPLYARSRAIEKRGGGREGGRGWGESERAKEKDKVTNIQRNEETK